MRLERCDGLTRDRIDRTDAPDHDTPTRAATSDSSRFPECVAPVAIGLARLNWEKANQTEQIARNDGLDAWQKKPLLPFTLPGYFRCEAKSWSYPCQDCETKPIAGTYIYVTTSEPRRVLCVECAARSNPGVAAALGQAKRN